MRGRLHRLEAIHHNFPKHNAPPLPLAGEGWGGGNRGQ
ncbi:hypothetical protein SAMN05444123_101514 [Rhodopseudomonas pseudopalustris]|uniref:Uncharacterized protein n=1 Tax=Rhodopseudomonas pseudopalustris TaxID=1513892 RepID=A0A1H8MGE8_9BRAD|nr:hypothetical protein SAMN05444123_101514 [Rhodopseudomonas pseudopalustris]